MTDLEQSQTQLFELPRAVVSRSRVKHTGIKDIDSVAKGERWLPQVGDRGTSLIEWGVEKVEIAAKHNAAGQAIGPMTAVAYCKAVVGGVEVMSVERKGER